MARNSLKLLLLAALVATPTYAAKLYKWVDERGNVTYLDHPPPEGRGRVEEKTVRDRPGAAGTPAMAEAAAKAPVNELIELIKTIGSIEENGRSK